MKARIVRVTVWEQVAVVKPLQPPEPRPGRSGRVRLRRLLILIALCLALGTAKTLLAPRPVAKIEVCSDQITGMSPCSQR